MKFLILHIGKTSDRGLASFVQEFVKRSGRYAQVEVSAVDGVKGKKLSEGEVKRGEADHLLARISDSDHVVLLDENGAMLGSRKFAEYINSHTMVSGQRMVFVIGGAYGFEDRMVARADKKISLSKMTMNHELALTFFAEQLYRALTIIKGHPYHND